MTRRNARLRISKELKFGLVCATLFHVLPPPPLWLLTHRRVIIASRAQIYKLPPEIQARTQILDELTCMLQVTNCKSILLIAIRNLKSSHRDLEQLITPGSFADLPGWSEAIRQSKGGPLPTRLYQVGWSWSIDVHHIRIIRDSSMFKSHTTLNRVVCIWSWDCSCSAPKEFWFVYYK